jgi:hypothetical protein
MPSLEKGLGNPQTLILTISENEMEKPSAGYPSRKFHGCTLPVMVNKTAGNPDAVFKKRQVVS